MNEEKKYDINGAVTISTEEYRGLIVEGLNSKHEADDYRSKFWKEQDKVKELEKKVEALQKATLRSQKFLNERQLLQEYELYLIRINKTEGSDE